MAEILLSVVVHKLAEFTVDNVLLLCGIDKAIVQLDSLKEISEEVEKLKKELCWIQDFIQDADKRCIVDKTHKRWVMDLIEIAYQIEDALDVFFLECSTALHGISLPKRILRFPKRILSFPKKILKLKLLYDFHEEMIKIRKEIARIDEYRMKYEIKNLGVDIKGQNTQSDWGHKLDPIGDPQVVGFDEDVQNVVKNLCDVNIKRLAVISIVGPGGLGKTTLAQKVCYSKKVRKEFGEPAWVTISQTYDLLGVLRKIAKSFHVESTDLDMNELATKIRELLTEKKYLIILDDVWTKELWDQLKKIMPNTENGSRVLITTRLIVDVARYADTTFEPYKPKVLSDPKSLELFLKNAIPENHKSSEGISPNLNELAEKFIKKCKGLPLALIVLGRLLSTLPFDYHHWKVVLDTMSWHDDGIQCSEVIATSFEHLPFERKFCFMYFAAFPEDQMIEAQPLLRIWIAEGFIPPESQRTLEETAERFLEDLIQRSMAQVVSRKEDGSIKYIRVHDILRDLAIEKAKENNFLVVCSKQADWKLEHCRKARRVAVHHSNFNDLMKQYACPNLRSLLIFEKSELDCSKYRLLRVFAQINYFHTEAELPNFTGLSHLRYLQLRQKKNGKNEIDFWQRLEAAKSLETLECYTVPHYYPLRMWKIETLRHVYLYHEISSSYIKGPPASANLPNLQTLKTMTPSPTWGTSKLPNTPELRELSIHLDEYQLDVIVALLGQLNHLVLLEMTSLNMELKKIKGVFPLLRNLKQMMIYNTITFGHSVELEDNMLPPNLIQLVLEGFKFTLDPMPVLEKLCSLKILTIKSSSYPLKISCSSGGFKQLEELSFYKIHSLQEWEIDLGAMPLLKFLKIDYCEELNVPQLEWFIENKSLRNLHWRLGGEPKLLIGNNNKITKIFKACPDIRRV